MRNQLDLSIMPEARRRTEYPCREFRIQCVREVVASAISDTPEKIAALWTELVPTAQWFQEDKECMVLFTLNSRRRCTGFHFVSMGTLDTILVHPRDIWRPALFDNAAAVIICHNHPSGDPTPSEADIKVTRDLIRAGQLLQIQLLDHLVIGKPSPERAQHWVSLRELGYFYS
jgi:DNA repair protein RadC